MIRTTTNVMIPVCPKCDVGLFILNFKAIEVDYCERCRGIWLDAGELEQLMTATGAVPRDPILPFLKQTGVVPRGKRRLCPRCDQPLHEISVTDPHRCAPLTLDSCPRGHGLWFDADELQRLLEMFPPDSGAGKTIHYLNEIFGIAPRT
jgi:Zn-finger nucleic acid-binding protein